MRFDAGQHMRMEQRMKLSPRMIQSMEILQLPAMALEERIQEEMEGNPVLELDEKLVEETNIKAAPDPDSQPMVISESGASSSEDFRRESEMSESYSDDWSQNTQESAEFHTPMRRDDGERDSKMDAMANASARATSLIDQLLDQWRYVETDPLTRAIGDHLITFIDDDGYLRTDVETIMRAATAPPGMTPENIESTLLELQQKLEPAGIGSRTVQECLLLQLDALSNEAGGAVDEEHRSGRRLVAEHLKDIEMNRLPRIARQTGLSMDQINAAMRRLRRLDPRPGRRLAPERPQTVVPDVIVEFDPVNDRYVAALARGRTPALRINPVYKEITADKTQDRTTRQYLAGHVSNARWLIDAIQQRNSTLLRVVNVVIDAQREFLDHGPQHLKPLPMIQVADQLGIHVGTVSRAVAEKYMQTPRGIFPLRMFFSGGTESSSGEEMSWAAVQAKLKEIVDGEDPRNPWSDDQLVEQLKAAGIEIARRTVAKYRQQMSIPPARRRKKF
jgi:RNA polymerase sigma-54 factor